MKIAAVVVTYNRLDLLKESLSAIEKQTLNLDSIIVINNKSTDGTADYLNTLDPSTFQIVNLDKNVGGAGGFSHGIKLAVEQGYDYVWVMDDDTIPEPTALRTLADAFSLADNVGFTVSKAVWTDGKPHKMNCPGLFVANRDRSEMFNLYSSPQCPAFLVDSATFVSMLISAKAVRQVGLPIAEFFIWSDDIEFSNRIVKAGYIGLYVDNSVVCHKTAENYFGRPEHTPPEGAWKFYYQARNTSYLRRKASKKSWIIFFFKQINRYRIYAHRINRRNDGNEALFKRQIRKGLWDGMFFNPEIKKVK